MHSLTRNLCPRWSTPLRGCVLATAAFALASSAWAQTNSCQIAVVGDSLAAGFQNFSLFDSASSAPLGVALPPGGQTHGFAALIAQQTNADLRLPLLYAPGIPPMLTATTVNNQLQITRLPAIPPSALPNGTYRVDPTVQTCNLAVPGVTLGEALARPFPGQPATNPVDALSASILAIPGNLVPGCGPIPAGSSAYVSQLACAVALKPSTVIVDIGNNDALGALTFGTNPTDPKVFQAEYRALLTGLAVTGAKIVVGNIPDVTVIPFLMPVSNWQTMCQVTNLPAGMKRTDYVVPNITDPNVTDFNVCTNYAVRPASLVNAAKKAVTAYNSIISSEAQRVGALVVDVYTLMNNVAAHGYTLSDGVTTLSPAYGGGIYSLDAIHPSNSGYAILANTFIAAMNPYLHTNIPPVSVDAVAAEDPLVPKH